MTIETMASNYLALERDGDVAVIWVDQPGARVNTLTRAAVDAFEEILAFVAQEEAITAAVFISRKEDSFIVGADLGMLQGFTAPAEAEALSHRAHQLLEQVRHLGKPTVAAMHGPVMGGGLEMTLGCTYRIATEDPRTCLALPEVMLGLIPGGGGTQYLPRLVGIRQGLEMMLTGKNVYPRRARKIGLVDALIHRYGLLDAARQAARQLAAGHLRPDRDREALADKLLESNPLSRRWLYKKALEQVQQETKGRYPAPSQVVACVREGIEEGLEAGLVKEARTFAELVFTPVSRNLVYLFFSKQAAEKNLLRDQARPVAKVGVIGAGFMGAGITEVSANNGFDVVLKDQNLSLAAEGKRPLWQSLSKKVAKRIVSSFERDVILGRVEPVEDYAAFRGVDLVIEAVPEDLALKRQVLVATEAVTSDDGIFASNTSALPIAAIAEASARPDNVVGMHYFSPVPAMPLLEIVKTARTPAWVLATVFEVGLRQGKAVIVVNDGPGFYTTRILALYLNEALLMLEEGADVAQVDAALESFGFPMGPFALIDLVGIDVAAKIAQVMQTHLKGRALKVSKAAEQLVHAGYLGQKNATGFYHYERKKGRRRVEKKDLNSNVYRTFGGHERAQYDRGRIQERLALMMVSEAVYCLQDGILTSAQDGDVGAVFGLGFPPFLGGPFRYVDRMTPQATVVALERLAQEYGPRFAPAPLLRTYAEENKAFHQAP